MRKNLNYGQLPNPYLKVFFIAIDRIKQSSRPIFGMSLNINLTRRNNEKNPYLKVFFIDIARIKQASRPIFGM